MNRHTRLAAILLGATALTGCANQDPTEEVQPPTASEDPYIGIPGSRFVAEIAEVPETDPALYASSLIFPEQPGLQFQGPDGTYCEMYGEADAHTTSPVAMCTHQGEGDINAVSVRQGEPATTHNVNRIFAPLEQTRVLEPGSRLIDGPVSCAVPAGDVRVMCAIDFYSFAVSREGVELS